MSVPACVAGYKENSEQQADLRQPETQPGGHEVAVPMGRGDQSVDAAVRVLSDVNVAISVPVSHPQPYPFPSVSRAASAVAWID